MDYTTRALQEQTLAFWATVVAFVLGAVAATLAFGSAVRPFSGAHSITAIAAPITGGTAALAFVISSLLHRRGETQLMPDWQAWISHVSFGALTLAFGGVSALSVLVAGDLLGSGLPGLELGAMGGGLVAGVAAALGGRFAFQAATDLRTADLAALLFTFLVVGTVYAMLTAAEPTWWERNFSQLGIGDGAWAFNGTLVVAGLLVGPLVRISDVTCIGSSTMQRCQELLASSWSGPWLVSPWPQSAGFHLILGPSRTRSRRLPR